MGPSTRVTTEHPWALPVGRPPRGIPQARGIQEVEDILAPDGDAPFAAGKAAMTLLGGRPVGRIDPGPVQTPFAREDRAEDLARAEAVVVPCLEQEQRGLRVANGLALAPPEFGVRPGHGP